MHNNQNEIEAHGGCGERMRMRALAAAMLLASIGCAGAQDDASAGRPIASLAASEAVTADLAVSRWEIWAQGDDLRILAESADQERAVDIFVPQDTARIDGVVRLDVSFPESGTLLLSRTGEVQGATSPFLRRLAGAVFTDIGQSGTMVPTTRAMDISAGSEIVATRSPLLLGNSGAFDLGFSLWGYNGTQIVGGVCGGGQTSGAHLDYSAWSERGASCWVIDWFDPSIPSDCRLRVHYGISGWRTDVCHWTVHWNTFQ